jgi:cysteine desulfurase
MEVNAAKLGCDFLSLSSHKFYGPKGSGILYQRKTAPFSPLVWGGSQERKRRGGTENVPGIVGTGKACELARKNWQREQKKLAILRDQFESAVEKKIPGVLIHGREAERLVNTSNMAFKGIDAEALLAALDQKEICVSSGSACMSGAGQPSHVIKAMGFSDEHARSSVRFSFGRFTKTEDIDILISEVKAAVEHIRNRD